MRFRIVLLLMAAAPVSGCGAGSSTLGEIDPDTVPANPTYSEHIAPRVNFYCGSCHSGSGAAAPGCTGDVPGEIDLSTYDCVKSDYISIYVQAFVEKGMPPGGALKMSPRDQAVFEKWKEQGYAK